MEERLEEERAAHSLSRKVAASRQEQLESDLSGSAAALTSLQRSLDDRNAKIEGENSAPGLPAPIPQREDVMLRIVWR